jgi:hypothetical protein
MTEIVYLISQEKEYLAGRLKSDESCAMMDPSGCIDVVGFNAASLFIRGSWNQLVLSKPEFVFRCNESVFRN